MAPLLNFILNRLVHEIVSGQVHLLDGQQRHAYQHRQARRHSHLQHHADEHDLPLRAPPAQQTCVPPCPVYRQCILTPLREISYLEQAGILLSHLAKRIEQNTEVVYRSGVAPNREASVSRDQPRKNEPSLAQVGLLDGRDDRRCNRDELSEVLPTTQS